MKILIIFLENDNIILRENDNHLIQVFYSISKWVDRQCCELLVKACLEIYVLLRFHFLAFSERVLFSLVLIRQ